MKHSEGEWKTFQKNDLMVKSMITSNFEKLHKRSIIELQDMIHAIYKNQQHRSALHEDIKKASITEKPIKAEVEIDSDEEILYHCNSQTKTLKEMEEMVTKCLTQKRGSI